MKEIIKKFIEHIIFYVRRFIPPSLLSLYHLALAFWGAVRYGFPSRRLTIIGITGTDGKSTTVELIAKIFKKANQKVASLSSINFTIGERAWTNTLGMTMPGRLRIQKFLRQALNAGCQYVVLEVTSEGIKQYRHRFINFDVAVLTNLTPEHIEAHQGFENYKRAKSELFKSAREIHVLNLDDQNVGYFSKIPSIQKVFYSTREKNLLKSFLTSSREGAVKLIKAEDIEQSLPGINFRVGGTNFHLNLFGEFNVSNALAAIGVGLSQGIDLKTCSSALAEVVAIPGRMEVIVQNPFQVIVDLAHTPNALEKVYEIIQKMKKRRLICVFGSAGGLRDKWKRPELGKIAAKYCDKIVLTNEDLYGENPSRILSMIRAGVFGIPFKRVNFFEVPDRRKGIRKGLELAEPEDIVMITGKGCEPWLSIEGDKKISWDDRKVVREELAKMRPTK